MPPAEAFEQNHAKLGTLTYANLEGSPPEPEPWRVKLSEIDDDIGLGSGAQVD